MYMYVCVSACFICMCVKCICTYLCLFHLYLCVYDINIHSYIRTYMRYDTASTGHLYTITKYNDTSG